MHLAKHLASHQHKIVFSEIKRISEKTIFISYFKNIFSSFAYNLLV